MNPINFLRLIHTIYFAPEPDLALIQRLGLLAVKLGQIHALRPDFVGEDRARILARLYSNADSIRPENALALIASYAGPAYMDNFADFDPVPFAAASIGQAHHAHLKDGTSVVVKIVKKEMAAELIRDARRIRSYFKLATLVYPKLRGVANPAELISQIETMTLNELDLRNEVAGQRILEKIVASNADRFDFSHLHFRTVHENLSSEKILVSNFADGETLDQLLSRGALPYDVLLELFNLHGFFLFAIGTFHGDIHPGNIVYKDGHLTFLDTGTIGRVPDIMRTGLFHMFDALSVDDFPRAAACLYSMSEQKLDAAAYAAFEKKFLALYADFPGKTVTEISLTKQMMRTIRLGVMSGMHFDKGMYDIIKSLMFLDGMVIRANPHAVLLHDMQRFIRNFTPFVQ